MKKLYWYFTNNTWYFTPSKTVAQNRADNPLDFFRSTVKEEV
jgi:hypothetical protein